MRKLLLFCFLAIFCVSIGEAQNVVANANVHMTSGQIEIYSFGEGNSMSFINDSLLVINSQEATIQIPIDNITKITFDEVLSLSHSSDAINSFAMYPNPTRDVVTISITKKDEMMKIYSVHGVLMYETKVYDACDVDLSFLPTGTYIVKIGVVYHKLIKL